MYRYQFTSTTKDLLEAEEAERSSFLRRPLRVALIVLAMAWLGAGLATFVRRPALQPLVWICLGTVVLYYLAVRPRRQRSGIRTNNAARQDVTLEFADEGLNVEISGVGQFTRRWDELAGITHTGQGILFYFADGVKNWLPNRVFAIEQERGTFLEFLKSHDVRSQGKSGDAA